MPPNHSKHGNDEDSEHSEFRKLPQIESCESLNNPSLAKAKGDNDNPVMISTQGDLLLSGILDPKALKQVRLPHSRTLLSSIEFHSQIKEIQQKSSREYDTAPNKLQQL